MSAIQLENRQLRARLEKLEQERHTLQAAIDQMPVAVFYKGRDGRYTGCNAEYERFTGISREDLIGKTLHDLVSPDQVAPLAAMDQAALSQMEKQVYESRKQAADGSWHDVELHKAPMRDAAGKPVGLVCAILDVTERKRAESEHRQSEGRLRLIFEHSNDGINMVEFDPETGKRRLLMCNDRYVEISGYTRAALMAADDLNTLVQPYDDPHRNQEEYRKIIQGVPFSGRSSWIRPDGRENCYEWMAAPIRIDERICILGIDRDITEHLRAERELAESRQQLQRIIDNSRDIIFQVDMDGNYTFGNSAAERLTGYSLDELLKMSMYQLVAPEYHDQLSERMRKRVAGEDLPQPFGFEIIHKSGRRLFLELTTSPVYKDGKITGVQGVARDLTEHMLAEQQLRATKEQLQYLISASPAVIFSLHVADTIRATYISDNVTKLFGHAPQQFIDDPDFWMSQIHPDDRPHVQQEIARSLQTGRFSCEFRARKSDGQYISVLDEANVMYDEQGRPVEFIGHAIDISELKETEANLRDSEQRYRTLVLNIPGAVYRCACDPEWTMQVISDAIRDISGYAPEEFIANSVRSYASIIHPDDRATVERIVHDGVAHRRPYIIEYRVLHADGTIRWVWEKGRGVFDADGKLLWLDGVILDDTERKRAEEALRAVHHQLMWAREEERRRLAAELHDSLGQELIALHLSLRGSLPELRGQLGKREVDTLVDAIQRVLGLIRDVRVISHGLYPPTLESLGLASALRQLAGELSGEFTIEVGVPEELQSARMPSAVEIALFRISQEAIHNALQHGRASHVKVELASGDRQIVLGIIDDGVGFDPRSAMGNGLGLTTMQERADAIGGELQFTSDCHGTRVEVRVPLSLPE